MSVPPDAPVPGRAAGRRADVFWAVALAVGTVVYLARLPRVLGDSDEALFLYEAKRLLAGQVFYRDLFDLITPGAHYLMAATFWVFGANMTTARIADAVLHGLVVAAVYGACRVLGVQRGLAAAAALVDPAICRPAWAVASPHWLSTLLTVLLVLVLLRAPTGFAAGIVLGLLVAVQQQRGAVMAAGAAALLGAEQLLSRRRASVALRPLPRRAAALAGGVLVVTVPIGAFLIGRAGVSPVLAALVLQPLRYPTVNPISWGSVALPAYAHYTYPTLLAWQPVGTVAMGIRTLADVLRGARGERVRRSVVLLVMSAAALGSVAYHPDYIHLAFVGPLFAILLADLVQGGLGLLGRRPWLERAGGAMLAAGLLLGLGLRLRTVMLGTWADAPVVRRTAFGTMNFPENRYEQLLAPVVDRLAAAKVRALFVYPVGTAWYLYTDTINPTPFQLLIPGYNTPAQIADALAILDRRRLPFVIAFPLSADDPVFTWIKQHYEPVGPSAPLLFRRVRDW
ncbi:MAG TPA: hypothetical protein VKW76_12840 [Candidatus Binatia bacterium]|nr:hypothetical protein [Candidatus Binatia bacterium]